MNNLIEEADVMPEITAASSEAPDPHGAEKIHPWRDVTQQVAPQPQEVAGLLVNLGRSVANCPTVDHDGLTRHERCALRQQELHGLDEVIGCCWPRNGASRDICALGLRD